MRTMGLVSAKLIELNVLSEGHAECTRISKKATSQHKRILGNESDDNQVEIIDCLHTYFWRIQKSLE